jgi:hypothetical protein
MNAWSAGLLSWTWQHRGSPVSDDRLTVPVTFVWNSCWIVL